jgi:hypothetical protein
MKAQGLHKIKRLKRLENGENTRKTAIYQGFCLKIAVFYSAIFDPLNRVFSAIFDPVTLRHPSPAHRIASVQHPYAPSHTPLGT